MMNWKTSSTRVNLLESIIFLICPQTHLPARSRYAVRLVANTKNGIAGTSLQIPRNSSSYSSRSSWAIVNSQLPPRNLATMHPKPRWPCSKHRAKAWTNRNRAQCSLQKSLLGLKWTPLRIFIPKIKWLTFLKSSTKILIKSSLQIVIITSKVRPDPRTPLVVPVATATLAMYLLVLATMPQTAA